MKSIWKLVSSSFSNSATLISSFDNPISLTYNFYSNADNIYSSSSVTSSFSSSYYLFSSIFIFLGLNSGTLTFRALAAISYIFLSYFIFRLKAIKLAHATINC